ncbi:MAG: hypothetical protein ACRCT6_10425, partial [Notoacmeibacter sp.]
MVTYAMRLFSFAILVLLALSGCNSTDATLGITPQDAGNQALSTGIQPATSAEAAKASARLYIAPII